MGSLVLSGPLFPLKVICLPVGDGREHFSTRVSTFRPWRAEASTPYSRLPASPSPVAELRTLTSSPSFTTSLSSWRVPPLQETPTQANSSTAQYRICGRPIESSTESTGRLSVPYDSLNSSPYRSWTVASPSTERERPAFTQTSDSQQNMMSSCLRHWQSSVNCAVHHCGQQ